MKVIPTLVTWKRDISFLLSSIKMKKKILKIVKEVIETEIFKKT